MSALITAQSGADTSSPRERLRLAIQRARELSSAASAAHQAIKGLNEQTPPLTLANGCATTKREDAEDDDELRFAPIELDEGDRSRQLAEQLTHAERARFVALVKHRPATFRLPQNRCTSFTPLAPTHPAGFCLPWRFAIEPRPIKWVPICFGEFPARSDPVKPPGFILPCRPALADRPPSAWLHEIKFDCYR